MKKRSLINNREAVKKALIAKTSSPIEEGSLKSAPLKYAAMKNAALKYAAMKYAAVKVASKKAK